MGRDLRFALRFLRKEAQTWVDDNGRGGTIVREQDSRWLDSHHDRSRCFDLGIIRI